MRPLWIMSSLKSTPPLHPRPFILFSPKYLKSSHSYTSPLIGALYNGRDIKAYSWQAANGYSMRDSSHYRGSKSSENQSCDLQRSLFSTKPLTGINFVITIIYCDVVHTVFFASPLSHLIFTTFLYYRCGFTHFAEKASKTQNTRTLL